jgi:hypothetical protein
VDVMEVDAVKDVEDVEVVETGVMVLAVFNDDLAIYCQMALRRWSIVVLSPHEPVC